MQLPDLEETGQFGYIHGITRIFIRGLEELELHKRPIHCSDLKREIIYIKNDQWEKENEEELTTWYKDGVEETGLEPHKKPEKC